MDPLWNDVSFETHEGGIAIYTEYMPVPGGRLYRTTATITDEDVGLQISVATTFVPTGED